MGERMADDLRKQLFDALLKQDIAFYDQHKTGELVNRYVCAKLCSNYDIVIYESYIFLIASAIQVEWGVVSSFFCLCVCLSVC